MWDLFAIILFLIFFIYYFHPQPIPFENFESTQPSSQPPPKQDQTQLAISNMMMQYNILDDRLKKVEKDVATNQSKIATNQSGIAKINAVISQLNAAAST